MDTSPHIITFQQKKPQIHQSAFIASSASVIGDVVIGEKSSVWFGTVLRGDVHHIRVGAMTNIQDNATLHVTSGVAPCIVGDQVTIGHNAVVHACTVEDLCLIGMGAVVLDKAVIGKGSIVGAGALVTQGKVFPPRSMILGSPAKRVREVTDEEFAGLIASADHYVDTANKYT